MQPVIFETHQHQYWHRFTNYLFAAGYHTAPLSAPEIPVAALNMPLAFIKARERFILAAVLSPKPGENLFLAPKDGRWLGAYVPASIRRYPFWLKVEPEKKETLFVDETSGLVDSDPNAGEPFFNLNGEWTDSLKQLVQFLRQTEQSRMVTENAVSFLAGAGVITEWNYKLAATDEKPVQTGLYRIDEVRLGNLPDADFLKLRRTGALKVAFAQLLSMGNMAKFAALNKLRQQQVAQDSPKPSFSLGEDDIFRFDK